MPSTIPMRIVKAEYQQPRGESQLTERGVEDVDASSGMPGALPAGTLPAGIPPEMMRRLQSGG
jgi:hypothetical protein